VLAEAVDAAREAGSPLLWANARSAAIGFYERLGWRVVGEEFVAADSGLPHKPMLIELTR
jgi:predicted GNAT family N-acyltransferase